MSTVFVNVAILQPPAPTGFEHIREFRPPKDGEWLQEGDGMAYQASCNWSDKPQNYRWILQRKPPAPSPREVFEREYGRIFSACPIPEGYEPAMKDGQPVMVTGAIPGQVWLAPSGVVYCNAFSSDRHPRLLLRKKAEPTLAEMIYAHELAWKNLQPCAEKIYPILRHIAAAIARLEGPR